MRSQLYIAGFVPVEIDAHYHPEIELIGDLAQTLVMLTESGPLSFDFAQQAATRREMTVDFSEYQNDAALGAIRPQKVLWDVREVLGADDILLSDVGAHKMWIAHHYQCHEPNTCLIPNGFCSIGYALPGAIAVHLVYPERRILSISGDAGFLMNVQEMETARRLNSHFVAMVRIPDLTEFVLIPS
ncbi:MAG: thiamine pyrophosphate-dependent enzyme [Methylococcales bacterium]